MMCKCGGEVIEVNTGYQCQSCDSLLTFVEIEAAGHADRAEEERDYDNDIGLVYL